MPRPESTGVGLALQLEHGSCMQPFSPGRFPTPWPRFGGPACALTVPLLCRSAPRSSGRRTPPRSPSPLQLKPSSSQSRGCCRGTCRSSWRAATTRTSWAPSCTRQVGLGARGAGEGPGGLSDCGSSLAGDAEGGCNVRVALVGSQGTVGIMGSLLVGLEDCGPSEQPMRRAEPCGCHWGGL